MSGIFGNGTTGTIIISSDTTLTSDKCYNNLTINSGVTLTTNGFRVRVAGTLLNNGTIHSGYVGSGGIGGKGGTGGVRTGGDGTDGSSSTTLGCGSGGGGGGGGAGTNYSSAKGGGDGGTGGNGGRKGGNLFVFAYILNNQGTITSSGESGYDGGDGNAYTFPYDLYGGGGGGGGGGTGGDGGNLILLYYSLINLGTVTSSGGMGGIGGSPGQNHGYDGGPAGGKGGNGIYGLGGQTTADAGNTRGGGGAGATGNSAITNYGGDGGDGKDGIQYVIPITDSDDWEFNLTDCNFGSVWNRLDGISESSCMELESFGSDDCEIYKVIDFEKNIYGISFNFNADIKVETISSATVYFKYEWLDDSDTVLASSAIATLTTTQEFTNHYLLNQVAPDGTYKIKIRFYIIGGSAKVFIENVNINEKYKYGIKIQDSSYFNIIKPEAITILSSGSVTMPNTLNGDGTYGYDIDLPGTESIPSSNLSVIISPTKNMNWTGLTIWNYNYLSSTSNCHYFPNSYLYSYYNYYTKNDTTGVMTSFTPGVPYLSGTYSTSQSQYDAIVSIFPIVGWDRLTDNLTSVRLFAATCYIIADGLETFKAVYSIGNTGGITDVNYSIFLKEYDY